MSLRLILELAILLASIALGARARSGWDFGAGLRIELSTASPVPSGDHDMSGTRWLRSAKRFRWTTAVNGGQPRSMAVNLKWPMTRGQYQ